VTICSSLQVPVASPLEVGVNGNHSRPEIEVLLHNVEGLLVGDLSSSISVGEH